ncbi:hypothetical protein ABTX64_22940, partial [Streptomyces sp900116325]
MALIDFPARHLDRDRETIRAYLNDERVPGQRRQPPDEFVPFLDYCRQRLADDPHLWSTTLLDELKELGYQGGYSTFARGLRRYQVRPHCDQPITIVALLATREAARPAIPGRIPDVVPERPPEHTSRQGPPALEGAIHHVEGYEAAYFVSYPLVLAFKGLG